MENIVQAVARDCLAETIKKVTEAGYHIVMHVHNEIIVDVPKDDINALQSITDIMKVSPPWGQGLPLKGDGYETEFYKKD